jgi:hypothetical protein
MTALPEEERARLLERSVARVMDDPARKREISEAIERAFDAWLDKKWAELGKWTFRGIVATAFTGAVWLWAKSKGLV